MSNPKIARAASTTLALSMMCFSAFAGMAVSGVPPKTAAVGKEYNYTPIVTGANTKTLEFSYLGRPSWSADYRESGSIIGTPTAPGVYPDIQIQAWDGEHFAVSAPFTITVLGTGTSAPPALQISGTPAGTATVGHYYAFNPTVVAPGGPSLTYSIANKPNWAAFSSATGALTGTPGASNTGVDPLIVLSVSNGAENASLAAFNITVQAAPAAATGGATVSWSKPSENTNGTPLTNLAGYIVRYGTSAAALSTQIQVASPNTTDLEIENLSAGNWYFEVAAVNTANVASAFSSPVTETVN